MSKEDLSRIVHDVALNPKFVGSAGTLTTGLGLNEIFGWVEKGVGFAAALMGLLVTVALWRKLSIERREAELRIQVLEDRLNRETIDSPLD